MGGRSFLTAGRTSNKFPLRFIHFNQLVLLRVVRIISVRSTGVYDGYLVPGTPVPRMYLYSNRSRFFFMIRTMSNKSHFLLSWIVSFWWTRSKAHTNVLVHASLATVLLEFIMKLIINHLLSKQTSDKSELPLGEAEVKCYQSSMVLVWWFAVSQEGFDLFPKRWCVIQYTGSGSYYSWWLLSH